MARKTWYVLSLGAGVNSTALMIWLIQKQKKLDEVVFADTGGEVPETYETLAKAESYLGRHDIPFRIVTTTNGTLFDCCWRRKVIPSQIWRWSTRDFKIRPIYKYYEALGVHVYQYVGIAYDELHRMKDSMVPFVTNLYPLVDQRFTREDCAKIIRRARFPMPVRSGCYFCPFNSTERWTWLRLNHPNLFDRAMELEEHSKHFPRQKLEDHTLRVLGETIDKSRPNGHTGVEDPCGPACMT